MSRSEWIEISIYRLVDGTEKKPVLLLIDGPEWAELIGKVYEREHWGYRIKVLAKDRLATHAMLNPRRTFVAVVPGIGEIARAIGRP